MIAISGPGSAPRRWIDVLGKWLGRLGLGCYTRPKIVLTLWAVLLALSAVAMMRLTVDPDVAGLLPSHYESVQDIEKVRERVGGVGYVVVLLKGGKREARRSLAAEVQQEIEQLDSVSYVESKRPEVFIRDKALWLMDIDDLRTLESRVHDRYEYAINRYFLDLDDKPPPQVEIQDLVANFSARFLGDGKDKEISELPETSDLYEDAARQALFVRPAHLATNLDFSKQVVSDVASAVQRAQEKHGETDVSVQLAGRYKKRVDLQAVLGNDLQLATVLALLLVGSYDWFYFKTPTAVVLLLLPLVSGLMLSYALASVTLGVLNILTAFLGAILVGLGVDTGIHLLGRIQENTAAGLPLSEAVDSALAGAGRVAVGASLTTAVAFGCLALTEFRAFREFGLLTAAGIVFVLLSYLTLMPALLRVAARYSFSRLSPNSSTLPGISRLLEHRKLALFLLGAPLIALVALAPRAQFDSDLSRMDQADLPSFRLDSEINDLLGRSQTPLVAFAKNDQQAGQVADVVRNQMAELGELATIGRVVTLAELIPSDLTEKEPLIASLRRMVSHLPQDDPWLVEMNDSFADIDTLVRSAAPELGDLPPGIRAVVAPPSNQGFGPLVLFYPTVSLGDATAMERLSDQVRLIQLAGGEMVRTAGEPMVVVDIFQLLRQDGPLILISTFVLVLLVLWLTLGSLRLAVFSVLPVVLILLLTAGGLAALGMRFTVLSVIVLPLLIGLGVDDSAHLLSRLADGTSVKSVWTHTGAAVSAALLTDVFGFGVLALCSHPGLRGLGIVALIGLLSNFVVCVILLPLLVSFRPQLFGAPTAQAHVPMGPLLVSRNG